eukprot:CAMPEP_0196652948 /NCGR_PEP_ID=MMETSP1086-20130531/2469_1 /TAXON_ID=77921 /ORGANISM="Cyanoptyche  gloeocystis , Strain SAG4.97" /LENGTH=47 /DNA_ID= /DNA_START= /DNA_END= /DNA_ORIENTATION=
MVSKTELGKKRLRSITGKSRRGPVLDGLVDRYHRQRLGLVLDGLRVE